MKQIEKGAAEIKRRRQLKNQEKGGDVNDIVIKADKANSFLDTSTDSRRKLLGFISCETCEEAAEGVSSAASAVGSAVGSAVDAAAGAIEAAADFASGLIGAASEAFEWLDRIADVITDGIAGLWDLVKDVISYVSLLFFSFILLNTINAYV
jgi:hypothetical protein|tara:strand:+ start:693 stop:1148 length:456 start_codon:yes stop_codon:yes gene_type:complete